MTEKALQATPAKAELVPITQEFGLTENQVALIKSQIAVGATDDELRYFMTVATKSGLDPFTRQIYAIKRKSWNGAKKAYEEKITVQTGIDGYRVIASRTGELAGIDDATYDDEKADHPGKASVTVYRMVAGNKVSFTASARWKEYCQTSKEGAPTGMWTKMPYLMLAKCAEALALRKAFPNELSGVYTAEEMAQVDNPEPTHSRARKVEPAATIDVTPVEGTPKLPEVKNKAIHASWNDLAEIEGWDKERSEGMRKATLKAKYGVESNNDLTIEQAEDFAKRIRDVVKEKKAAKQPEPQKAEETTVETVAEAFGGKVIETCKTCKKEFEDDGSKTGNAEAIRFAGECNGCLEGSK